MKIAAAQLACAPADVPANAARAAALAVRAREEGAELVVFPELVLSGYALPAIAADPGLWLSGPEDPRLDPVRSAGIATAVNVALRADGPRPVIATLVHDARGAHVTTYVKQHLYLHEQEVFAAGGVPGRFELGGIGFSLGICYDNHFPEVPGAGAAAGCRVHLASSLYGTGGGIAERSTIHPGIARDHGMYVALANHVGPAGPWTGCGGAAVWAPGGALLAEADDRTPSLALAEVEPPVGA
ncbi:carbon-nitrogen hydrolase family protein [Streptomyces sp. NBC_00503]|uniref:carbon-nitrogen hydrolase family protein n=1 Tax=Streptomyces sp. NBC_00503 TaxID=2903659 RepID=UPI002E80705C|nr:carbon-nitrogen hydrolase family protein [Streptomyces sp. NBC_00503]WUD81192.1 carbon-nitrogen hydrolase family protein [Streptomyces sp. NBC_00503]